jgi:hypothetical protein
LSCCLLTSHWAVFDFVMFPRMLSRFVLQVIEAICWPLAYMGCYLPIRLLTKHSCSR